MKMVCPSDGNILLVRWVATKHLTSYMYIRMDGGGGEGGRINPWATTDTTPQCPLTGDKKHNKVATNVMKIGTRR